MIEQIEQYLIDPQVSDVMIVGELGVWIERDGVLSRSPYVLSRSEIELFIERTIAPLGLHVDRSSPMVDARLADGSRINVVVPPVALEGPCVTIRRFAVRPLKLENFADGEAKATLQNAVTERQNVLVIGATGAGKTTLLNAMAGHVGVDERIVTIEDTAELRLQTEHVIRLEARPNNTEGVGGVSVRQLVRNSLRMRPDRIVVGEVRGPEALDMLQAMNTGHSGSMSTCHANGPLDAVRRLETMILMGNVNLPLAAVRQQLGSALDLIVHVGRTGSATRKVQEIASVSCVDGDVVLKRVA